jgi:tRNA pseudouridine38-40 synthase
MQRNIKLLIAFDGTDFQGWQSQKNGRTIQDAIEKGLLVMTKRAVTLHGAGRTDAGVHAEGMVANFHTSTIINCSAFMKGLNSMLPSSIRILETTDVPADFHARFSAKGKRYGYTIQTGRIQSPLLRLYALHLPWKPDFQAMHSCLACVVGTHDFSSFENSGSRDKDLQPSRGAVRTIYEARLEEHGNQMYTFVFTGDGFLRNMVRNLVGTLLQAGRGRISADEFVAILKARNRETAGPTAPPHGLVLKEVFY